MTKKEKTQLIVVGVLVLVFAILTIRMFSKINKKPASFKVSKVENTVVDYKTTSSTNQKVGGRDYFLLIQESREMDLKRDPFSRKSASANSGPRLDGIAWEEASPSAIVNDKVVTIGGTYIFGTVTAITKTSVFYNDGEKIIELTIRQDK